MTLDRAASTSSHCNTGTPPDYRNYSVRHELELLLKMKSNYSTLFARTVTEDDRGHLSPRRRGDGVLENSSVRREVHHCVLVRYRFRTRKVQFQHVWLEEYESPTDYFFDTFDGYAATCHMPCVDWGLSVTADVTPTALWCLLH